MGLRLPVVLAVLVLLAGCGSAAGPASPGRGTATVTPAPVPTTASGLTVRIAYRNVTRYHPSPATWMTGDRCGIANAWAR